MEAEIFSNTESNYYIPTLTPRENEVLFLTINGFTAQEIASRLFLSRRTIEGYIENIKNKLGCRKKNDLIRKALISS